MRSVPYPFHPQMAKVQLRGLDDKKARRRRIEELLETVGLADAANRKLKGFSGGMKRRVGIRRRS